MTMQRIEIPGHAPGRVDVFDVDLPLPEAQRLAQDPGRLAAALGAAPQSPEHMDVFDTALMGDMGLQGYLRDGIGIAGDDLTPHAKALGSVDLAVILRRAAFDDTPVTLEVRAPLRHIATLHEAEARIDLTPLRSAAASGHLPDVGAPPAEAPRANRWLWIALAVAVLLLLAAILPIFATR